MTNEQQNREWQLNQLHSTIWSIADDLRGQVDGWDFKIYVLGFLFYRYISENFVEYANKQTVFNMLKNNDYTQIEDEHADVIREKALNEKGFFIRPSQLFQNIKIKAIENKNISQTIDSIFREIEQITIGYASNKAFKGLFVDLNVNSPKLGNTEKDRSEKLKELLNKIDSLELGKFQENSIDVFGSAYEYLMQMYATHAGKSGGEFYTPQEVAELLVRLATVGKKTVNGVYDPACGSGGLLLKFAKIIGKNNVKNGFFGQEINLTTYNLCRFNMFLHDLNFSEFNISLGDTLTSPDNDHKNQQPFEAIVSNPPYSIQWIGDNDPTLLKDERFAKVGCLPPKSKADWAFVLHGLSWLSDIGTATYVVFPGILYRKGNEQAIRKYLIENNFIDCIISLPTDMFFGVSISTCIIVLKRRKKYNNVLFIHATEEFTRKGTKNVIQEQQIQKIIDVYTNRQENQTFSNIVSLEEIVKNDYNLSPASYIDIDMHFEKVNITDLNRKIQRNVEQQESIREHISEIIKDLQ